jgi:uncharacterized protein (DUF1778 family)
MIQNDTKNAEIKIRISKQDKKTLQHIANKQNTSLSDYIRSKCIEDLDSRLNLIPDAVETWNAYNEILREIDATGNQKLKETIQEIIVKHLPYATDRKELR